MKTNLPTRKKAVVLDFYWLDGRGAHQKLAKVMAEQFVKLKSKKIGDMTFVHASFTQENFILASKIFDLIGRAKTTTINVRGLPTTSKINVANIFWCFNRSMRSKAKDYCSIDIAEVRTNEVEIGVRVNTYGISVGEGKKPRRKYRPTKHPCHLCYYSTPKESTNSPKDYLEALEEVARLNHADICPRFRGV